MTADPPRLDATAAAFIAAVVAHLTGPGLVAQALADRALADLDARGHTP